MAGMYQSQVLDSSKATDHIKSADHTVICWFSVILSQWQNQTSISKTACSRLSELILISVVIQYLALSLKNNCDNLFLEPLCLLIVKELAIHICLWMPAEVLWRDEIVCISLVPTGH